MAKTLLGAEAQFELRQALHVATLDALIASRRWQPGELVFQGGTSLHLAHGSPRFSEDLDFLVDDALDLGTLGRSVQARLVGTPWLPKGTSLEVTKAKDDRNPHSFVVVVGGPNVIGAVRVRVELWRTNKESMLPLRVGVTPVRLAGGPAAGAQAFVPTADLHEIFVDKVFAVGARPYLKSRDLFDLHWIVVRNEAFAVTGDAMRLRLATYPNETPAAWLAKARSRADDLPARAPAVGKDLRRWLPSSWPMDEAAASGMIDVSVKALRRGIAVMEAIERTDRAGGERDGDAQGARS